ncbi:hypothetical protein AVEN_255400-1 [Araneus ventricosus]|uniref:Uncharacterized protein n=1 Tax=Araneus ventricosus TaxID=182803 RepID=A0A4Y2HTD4_ARAVE|nr:hypothetical protein AVEN_255400-1 [Araneus ventricosus]
MGHLQVSACELFNGPSLIWALRARQHYHWTVDDWKHVAWSDKSRFQLYRTDARVRVWRQHHEFMELTCEQGTVQSGGASVMVWDVCSWRVMGPLIRLRDDSDR